MIGHQPTPSVRDRVHRAAVSARTLLREGANHPLTRAAAVALLQAAAGHLGPAGPGGRRTSECRCRVSPR